MVTRFEEIGRLPVPPDNVAIAIRRLEAGTTVEYAGSRFSLSHTILEGHRFAVQPIHPGEPLLSWNRPFGVAIVEIMPGDYVRNENVLRELRRRTLDFALPETPNFADQIAPFVFDESRFQPSPPTPRYDETLTFMGYPRPGGRGAGTRNLIVLLGTSSLVAGFVRTLEARLKPLAEAYSNIDGIAAVAHTEGGHEQPNNRDLLLRTLAGFVVHPNVGAVLIVDYGSEAVNNAHLREYMEQHNYPLADVPHRFVSLSRSFRDDLDSCAEIVSDWLEAVSAVNRAEVPLTELKIALQCGGSDAFSGISGNPLAGWVAREVIQHGGSANLAETDELIGAESYTLEKVRDADLAKKFLATLDRFKTWAGWHGHSAEGNPSGGNLYRGLYNIYLKSLGAATKRDPAVRLDYVIDYGEPMREPGYYFMDSPGNDLESIAGQVASGCNMIFFVTGNGSITNFPFVPTIKIVTTSERYRLLSNEMDVNAGAYLDGTPMDELGQETLQLTVAVASGRRTVGERAGHAQVQIWRDWRLTRPTDLSRYRRAEYSGKPLSIRGGMAVPDMRFPAYRIRRGFAADQVGLILPTSLCSGQIARMCAEQLNAMRLGQNRGVSRFVTLVHTEGCGAANGDELDNTLIGYLIHPMVRAALLLEHGCEKTHNSYFRQLMDDKGLDPQNFGWASVQLDGGIENVIDKMRRWFEGRLTSAPQPEMAEVGLEAVRLGLVTYGEVTAELARQFAVLTGTIVAAGGSVVVPHNDTLLGHLAYTKTLSIPEAPEPTLGYAQQAEATGLHVMDMPSRQWSETLTGLGATGVDLILAHVDSRPMSGHPLIPVLQVTSNPEAGARYAADFDLILNHSHTHWSGQLLDRAVSVLSREYMPRLADSGNIDFQITRGPLGVSL